LVAWGTLARVIVPHERPYRTILRPEADRARKGALFFLLKYSSDLNPIQQLFAKLKPWLRQGAKRSLPGGSRETAGHPVGDFVANPSEAEDGYVLPVGSHSTDRRGSRVPC
jgi:hypothetical protein